MTTKAELLEELTISQPRVRLGRQDGLSAARVCPQLSAETAYREDPDNWRAKYEEALEEIRRLQTMNSLAWSRVELLRGQVARLQGALLGAAE